MWVYDALAMHINLLPRSSQAECCVQCFYETSAGLTDPVPKTKSVSENSHPN
jgi:hypothetical protein